MVPALQTISKSSYLLPNMLRPLNFSSVSKSQRPLMGITDDMA
jgi:hypothetical protein